MKKVLTIAGSDSSGGAGIQADLKTMCAHKVYGMSAITALTAQNTLGVTGVLEVPAPFVEKQLDAVFTDIVPDAVKIGMLASEKIMTAVGLKLMEYRARNIVLDPVMVSTSGSLLMDPAAKDCILYDLMPMATIVTPNIPETTELTGIPIESLADMIVAIGVLYEKVNKRREYLIEDLKKNGIENTIYPKETAILVKGGHSINDADDLLFANEQAVLIKGERIDNENTHGTGCTLSSAIACNLAKGVELEQAVRNAKEYISGALRSGLDIGKGHGPLDHLFGIKVE